MNYTCLLFALLQTATTQASVTLNFGTQMLQSTLTNKDFMPYGIVSSAVQNGVSDIYARIATLTTYTSGSGTSGGPAGDARINQQGNTTTTFSFDLVFYDVDGYSDAINR